MDNFQETNLQEEVPSKLKRLHSTRHHVRSRSVSLASTMNNLQKIANKNTTEKKTKAPVSFCLNDSDQNKWLLTNIEQCHLWLHGRLFAQWFCPCGQCYPRDQSNHMAATVKVARQQTTPELSGAFRTLPPEPTPAYTGTLRNLPEPSGTCLRNLHHFTPELSGTFRNLPPELTPFYKELSGTFWNPPPEPTPAHSGTFRNLPEPSSGTCSCDPHRHTPELIWAEDPISLRCWGMMLFWKTNKFLFICFYENHYGKNMKMYEHFSLKKIYVFWQKTENHILFIKLTINCPYFSYCFHKCFHNLENKLWWHPQQQCHVWLYGRHFFCAMVQRNKPRRNSPEPSEPCLRNPTNTSTRWNSPEPSRTCLRNLQHRNFPEPSRTCLRNLHQHTPEPSWNLHQHIPELSRTFRNILPEPAPATRADRHRSLSGLKTPLAYAVGDKTKNAQEKIVKSLSNHTQSIVKSFFYFDSFSNIPNLNISNM